MSPDHDWPVLSPFCKLSGAANEDPAHGSSTGNDSSDDGAEVAVRTDGTLLAALLSGTIFVRSFASVLFLLAKFLQPLRL